MEGTPECSAPDLRDVEGKVGRKTPEGLLRSLRGEGEPVSALLQPSRGMPEAGHGLGLGDKVTALRLELAYLRAIDVKILQQLVTVNEGIEAVRWLLEERGALASRCSSLTSSQYSLTGGSPGACSHRDSWESLPDPTPTTTTAAAVDQLDSVSIGSYLDTLASGAEPEDEGLSEAGPRHPPTGMTWAKAPPSEERLWIEADTASGARSGQKPPGEEVPEDVRSGLSYGAHWYWGRCQDDVTFL
ncbi:leucine rich adaptor protein 1 [Phascolarctos cinereus]|uniref:Leucine rich adaptor protein 1 n=1 Tax=Phascolarctos cinereus TaxID=38626 RepID=A0A6P5KFI4_PHACI|nr:leucine rich adaptor protein 1 [Phascolarctos cinereus]